MTHDPLCPDSDPNRWVSKDFNGNSFSCRCEEYAKVREDMLAKCIAAVTVDLVNRGLDAYDDEFLSRSCPHPDGSDSVCYECNKERVVQEIRTAIRALKEKS